MPQHLCLVTTFSVGDGVQLRPGRTLAEIVEILPDPGSHTLLKVRTERGEDLRVWPQEVDLLVSAVPDAEAVR